MSIQMPEKLLIPMSNIKGHAKHLLETVQKHTEVKYVAMALLFFTTLFCLIGYISVKKENQNLTLDMDDIISRLKSLQGQFEFLNGKIYTFHMGEVTYEKAKSVCSSEGLILTEPTVLEAQEISKAAERRGMKNFWLGLRANRTGADGHFHWESSNKPLIRKIYRNPPRTVCVPSRDLRPVCDQYCVLASDDGHWQSTCCDRSITFVCEGKNLA